MGKYLKISIKFRLHIILQSFFQLASEVLYNFHSITITFFQKFPKFFFNFRSYFWNYGKFMSQFLKILSSEFLHFSQKFVNFVRIFLVFFFSQFLHNFLTSESIIPINYNKNFRVSCLSTPEHSHLGSPVLAHYSYWYLGTHRRYSHPGTLVPGNYSNLGTPVPSHYPYLVSPYTVTTLTWIRPYTVTTLT